MKSPVVGTLVGKPGTLQGGSKSHRITENQCSVRFGSGAAEGRTYAFFVKSEGSGPEQVTSMFDHMHFVFVWLDFLDYPDHSLFVHNRPLLARMVRLTEDS